MRLSYYYFFAIVFSSSYYIAFVVSLLNINDSRMLIRSSILQRTYKGKILLTTAKFSFQMNATKYLSCISSGNEKFSTLDSNIWSNKVIVIAGKWIINCLLYYIVCTIIIRLYSINN